MQEHEAVIAILQNQVGLAYGEAAAQRAKLLVATTRIEELEAQLASQQQAADQPPTDQRDEA